MPKAMWRPLRGGVIIRLHGLRATPPPSDDYPTGRAPWWCWAWPKLSFVPFQ